jgi:hypothetical protein
VFLPIQLYNEWEGGGRPRSAAAARQHLPIRRRPLSVSHILDPTRLLYRMTGLSAYLPQPRRARSRWVGRPAILPSAPDAPQWLRYLAVTISMLGLQLVWSCEMAQASPYLLSLGVSKSMMAIVFLAGSCSSFYASSSSSNFLSRRTAVRPHCTAPCRCPLRLMQVLVRPPPPIHHRRLCCDELRSALAGMGFGSSRSCSGEWG